MHLSGLGANIGAAPLKAPSPPGPAAGPLGSGLGNPGHFVPSFSNCHGYHTAFFVMYWVVFRSVALAHLGLLSESSLAG